jgi:P-type E1-E2 ATPase
VEIVPLEEVTAGDVLLVASGDVVPVDGTVRASIAVLDESALTGEARPVEHGHGDLVRSGTVNAGPPFDLRASGSAADSTYAGIVRLVAEAENSQAPFVRLADRYAMWFLPLTLAVAGAAWVLGGATRAVAVLVVATPCPLILAAPVALVSGLSAAARRGVVVKSGAVLERLAQCTTLVMDKTGTLTAGQRYGEQQGQDAAHRAQQHDPGLSIPGRDGWHRVAGRLRPWPLSTKGPGTCCGAGGSPSNT